MNPANFQNMAAQGMVPQGQQAVPQPGGQPRGPVSQAVQQRIFQLLQDQLQQQTWQGWQASMQPTQRAQVIYQIVSQLRLIKAEMPVDQAINVAMSFEQKVFTSANDRAAYDQQWRDKLQEIAFTRTTLAAKMQQQMQNGQPQMNMGHPQAQMPGMTPNPNQMQMQMQMQMQQRFPNNQVQHLNQPPAMGMSNQQQQMHMGNPQQRIQMPQNIQQSLPPQVQLTPQDHQEIARMAQQLAQTAPPDQINAIRSQVSNSPQRQQLEAQGIDPFTHWFRQAATLRYVAAKKAAVQRNSQLVQGPNGVNVDQARPISQNAVQTQGPQAGGISAPQGFDPLFMGNMDQIIAQQQNAQRLQEAGQVVVPASNVQGMSEQQRIAMRNGAQQPNTRNMNRPPQTPNMTQPQQASWNPQGQPATGQAPGQIQNQAQPNNCANAVPMPTQLHGQIGGLNATAGRMPQPNANMPTLTRGVGHQGQTQQPQNMWPQQGTPHMQQPGQMTLQNTQPNNANGAPQRPRLPPGKMNNAQMSQYLSTLSDNDRRAFLTQIQQKQNGAVAPQSQTARPESVAMQTQRSQAGQHDSQPASQAPGRVPNGTQQPNGAHQQQVSASQPGQPQKAPQKPGDAAQIARQKQQAALATGVQALTPEIERWMDGQPFPPGILNANNALSKLPPSVTTWGQLKAWVKENSAGLPAGSEVKLRGLQALHFQSISKRQQQQNQPQPAMQPTAPMMPQPNQQQMPAQGSMPNLQPPTMQEIQAARTHYPPLQTMADEQVKALMMRQRQERWMKAQQQNLSPQQQAEMRYMHQQRQQHAQLQQQQQQQLQQQQQQIQSVHSNQPPQNQATPQQAHAQQSKQGPQVKGQAPGKAPQAPMQAQSASKGVKRVSSDDVVEVPDPKIATTPQRAPAPKASQKANAPNSRPQKATQSTQQQNSRIEAERRTKQAQLNQGPQPGQVPSNMQPQPLPPPEEREKLNMRLNQLNEEVNRSLPPRQPVSMDVATRMKMVAKLRDAREMIVRMDKFLPLFFTMFRNEDGARDLIRTRRLLTAQGKNSDLHNPIDHFTISSEELDQAAGLLGKLYKYTMNKVAEQRSRGNAAQNAPGVSPSQQPAKPELSAANLQQHQTSMQAERQASVQKSHHNSNRAPPAPTSDKPPYPWMGAQSPQGIPRYGPNELTQKNLKLPTNKKRKTNNQTGSDASTPAQRADTPMQKPSPLANKGLSPELQRLPAPVMFRCPVPNCSSGTTGFATQADLEKHQVDMHKPKEPVIEDPLKFALEHMQFAMNLDKKGRSKSKREGPAKAEAPTMKKSSSMEGMPAMKQEIATPMSRGPTQTAPTAASNYLLKTPQITTMKTPASETKALPKALAKENTPAIVTDDPWADSLIQQDTIREAFSGLSTLNGPKAWTKIQDFYLTPESNSSENTEKNSPRPSDISENDMVKINMDLDDKGWIPISWSDAIDPMMEFEELDLGNDSFRADTMDWESMFGEPVEVAEEKAKAAQKKYLRNPYGPTEEWLKIMT